MDFNLIWQTILIFIVGTFYLRVSGRKTISQMTIPQTVLVIAIGTLLIDPVTRKGFWATFFLAGILVLSLILTEYIQLKFDKAETVISGKAVPVIENGALLVANMKKLRLTVDKLEERLRQVGITSIEDVQYATMESNGQLGYTLKPEKQPATKEDIQNLIALIQTGKTLDMNNETKQNIFVETITKKNTHEVPKKLQ